jgi:hypothetical protein
MGAARALGLVLPGLTILYSSADFPSMRCNPVIDRVYHTCQQYLYDTWGLSLRKGDTEMETQKQIGDEATPAKRKPQKRYRIGTQLSISRALYRKCQQRARSEALPFATWLVRLAKRELRRKPSL